MCNGGRILNHLKHFVSLKSTAIMIVGWQGKETLGRSLVDSASEIFINGERYNVNAKTETEQFVFWKDADRLDLYKDTYGALYNWHTVNTKKLAPSGWHVPTDVEWDTLKNYLIANGYNWGGATTGNAIAKSMADTTAWELTVGVGPESIGNDLSKNNSSKFTAQPGGCREKEAAFSGIGRGGCLWCVTEQNTTDAYFRFLYYYYESLVNKETDKMCGLSVRLLRD